MIKLVFLFCLFIFFLNVLAAQDMSGEKLKVFIEGDIADFNYLRSNMAFVDFVNGPYTSDVHIIVTRKNTASGGNHYYITYIPVTIKTLDRFMLNCITSSQGTQDDERSQLAESVKSGTLIFINEKQLRYKIRVVDDNPASTYNISQIKSDDPWNNWVFNIGINGGLEAEEQKRNVEYEASLEANRETDIWRIRNEYNFGWEETFIDSKGGSNNSVIRAYNQEQEFNSRITYSLSPHWSAGLFVKGNQITYRNTRFNGNMSAALEYNIYPWDQINRRIFTVAYYIGPEYFDYYETTILDKSSEFKWAENIKIDLQKIEQWGELSVWLKADHYFPDFKFYSIETGTEFSMRIAKGLFIEFEIAIEKIKNQLYLQAGGVSEEELLLNTRKLPTSFEFSTEIGIKYRFGSIFNNVVNQRL